MPQTIPWPPAAAELEALLDARESALLEKKQLFFDLEDAGGRARMLKHVLAMANSASEAEPGIILFGVTDDRHGGERVGIEKAPEQDRITHLLKHYTQPSPDARLHVWKVRQRTFALLAVFRTDNWPYYASRDIEGVLSSDVVYHRVGSTVSILKPAQLEKRLRQKADRLGPAPAEVLRMGFVERGGWTQHRGPVLRLTNLSGESLRDIWVTFDVSSPFDATVFYRQPALNGATLDAGASRDVECQLRSLIFYRKDQSFGQHVMDRWFDVRAYVAYRDELGFFRELTAVMRLDT